MGRDREASDLRDRLAATVAGAGGCVVVTGPPGIGKTRLLAEARRSATELGLAVAPGRALELDRAAPLTTLLTALRATAPVPIDLPELREPPADRLWFVDRLAEALEEYVADRPLLVIIDDAHWTDELSALALRVLVPRLASSPLRWVLARRPVPAPSPAQDTIDWLVEEGAHEIRLGKLDDGSVKALCSNVLGAEPDATVLAVAPRGQGNPFLLEQYLRTLSETGQILVTGGFASVVGENLPSTFASAVDQRLRGLSEPTRRLLRVGSVFGRPFTVHEAAGLLNVRAPDLVAAAQEAVSAGVLVEQETALAFEHDLMRQAIYNHMSEPVRAAMHREAAESLRRAGRPVMEVAEHLMLTGPAGDREAVDVLRAAAEEAAGRAPGTAAALIVRALDLMGRDDPDRLAVTADAVRLLAASGRLPEARRYGEEVLGAGADPRTEAGVLLGLAEALKHAGQNAAAVRYARRGLEKPDVPPALRASLHAIEAHALLYAEDMTGADHAGAEADRLGELSGEHSASTFGNAARSVVAAIEGRLDDGEAHARRAVAIADRAGGPSLQRHPRIWLGSALAALDRFDEAEEAYTIGRLNAERFGTGWSQPLWHYYNGCLLYARGRLDEAVAEAEAGVHIAKQLTAEALRVPLLGLLARIAVDRAQLPVAREHLRRMEALCRKGVTAAPEDVIWSLAVLDAADDQPRGALRRLSAMYGALPDRMLLLSNDPGAGAELVRIARRAEAMDLAGAAAGAARLLADRNPKVVSLVAAAAHAEGLYLADADRLRQAVELYRASPRPLARASALEDAGMAEDAAGNRTAAVALLEEAIREYGTCGAQRGVARVERRLRHLGVRARPTVEPRRDRTPLDGLTATELNIARQVAQGRSNREIAQALDRSPHTVDSHLRKVFQKTGVNNRVALTNLLAHLEPND